MVEENDCLEPALVMIERIILYHALLVGEV